MSGECVYKALKSCISEFIDYFGKTNHKKTIVLLTSQFELDCTKRELSKLIKQLNTLNIHILVLGYELQENSWIEKSDSGSSESEYKVRDSKKDVTDEANLLKF